MSTVVTTTEEVVVNTASEQVLVSATIEQTVNTVVTATEQVVVNTTDEQVLVNAAGESHVVTTAAEQGPPGPPGPAGSSGAVNLPFIAGMTLSGHRAVRAEAGEAVYADCTVLTDAQQVLGITLGAAMAGASVDVQASGEMVEPSWSWTPGLPVFLGVNGLLTQTPPAVGFQLIVAVAVSPTKIIVGIKQPIIL